MVSLVFLTSLLPFVYAHFQLNSPPARGFDEDTLATFPCGGQDTVSSNRSMFPLTGGPIQLNMEHDHAEVQVLLALGNVPADNFNIVLQPIFMEEGIGKFCMGDVMVPSSLGIKDGDNGTIQVVTNGDPNGGLYNCADVTFSSSAPMGDCTNGTGVTATSYTGPNKNSNGSDSSMGSGSGTGTAATASPSPTSGAGLSIELGLWSVVGAVFVAALA
ncbi:hypothetical protein ABVK25_010933 [Lepraria finkii]|uniref:Copper acquisition factor BIM1-like domain-containing protein n=1 Tax=Lepraria finkii TaxID=1340010 RepID=A0ABR4ASZ0_9LECA